MDLDLAGAACLVNKTGYTSAFSGVNPQSSPYSGLLLQDVNHKFQYPVDPNRFFNVVVGNSDETVTQPV